GWFSYGLVNTAYICGGCVSGRGGGRENIYAGRGSRFRHKYRNTRAERGGIALASPEHGARNINDDGCFYTGSVGRIGIGSSATAMAYRRAPEAAIRTAHGLRSRSPDLLCSSESDPERPAPARRVESIQAAKLPEHCWRCAPTGSI